REDQYPESLRSLIEEKNPEIGEIVNSKKEAFVKCSVGFLQLLEVQIPSRNPVNISAFLNGAKLTAKSHFINK
ncbi:MAG: hypothetical protein LBB07_02485, partial [Bifidobacteriaceae bacterium]|nr:hypothetical protein [Bifidobacteriaceae bacterium]